MQELIQHLIDKAGISSEQATKSIDAVKSFVKEKFPMLGGAVDQMMGSNTSTTTTTNTSTENNNNSETPKADTTTSTEEGILDKISDVIPGEIGQKVEDFAKGLGDKLGGFFGK